eukprot:TRINITY_DN51494_c0_g1_i1.p2 TRINITY_DN51494_c0_g1~~TRINITY_DN51494_c0_g1_i1.p2  ORF type:complete len:197 (+),score=83.23 TRINITY_DN51494_c0_g1_i1:92-682(+)
MASQHNRSGTYKALIEGNLAQPVSHEMELHAKVFGPDSLKEKQPHGLPPEEVLNEELRVMKVKPNMYSSIAGASSSTFHQYRFQRRREHERVEAMYKEAAQELKDKEFEQRRAERQAAEAAKTQKRAAKRQKKKAAKRRRATEGAKPGAAAASAESSSEEEGEHAPAAAPAAAAAATGAAGGGPPPQPEPRPAAGE